MTFAPILLGDAEVASLLDIDTAIASQRAAFTALGNGTAQLAEKTVLPNPADGSVALCYVSRLSAEHGAVCKFVDVHPGNPDRGLPSISATVLVTDAETGRLAAVLDGARLTEVRTAAGSAVAADVLAPADIDELAVLGSGVQGRAHVRAISRVRELRRVSIWSPSAARREAAAAELGAELGLDVRAVADPASAVRGAGLVVTCTLSETPVLPTDELAPAATVISVGSFEPHRCEVGEKLVRAARVVVDDVDTALAHAGPIMREVASGALDPAALVSLGEIVVGAQPARPDPQQPVFYNSVGLGVQDAAAAHAVLAARSASRG